MRDLAEVRRFWPWMRPSDWFGDKRAFWARTVRGVQVAVAFHGPVLWSPGWYSVSFFDSRSRRWSKSSPRSGNDFFDPHAGVGPTIATAMAAAGFGVRKKGLAKQVRDWFRMTPEKRIELAKDADMQDLLLRPWMMVNRKPKQMVPMLESRQRPRKGVRLGRRTRKARVIAEFVAYRDAGLLTPAEVRASREP